MVELRMVNKVFVQTKPDLMIVWTLETQITSKSTELS